MIVLHPPLHHCVPFDQDKEGIDENTEQGDYHQSGKHRGRIEIVACITDVPA